MLFNITTDPADTDRFENQEELLSLMDGFDGVELLCFEPDLRGLIPKERVFGLHMCYFPYWLDFWNGDMRAALHEFGSQEECRAYYGGDTPGALLARFRKDLTYAKFYGAEYVVFHVSDATIREAFTRDHRHTDAEVIDAACELLNQLFAEEDGRIALLLENLWLPGLTFTDPAMTKRLLDGIRYSNKGIMLDTGHLLHTNTKLRSQQGGLRYIHDMLDLHGELADAIRGVHLNQSLTGAYSERMMSCPPSPDIPYADLVMQAFSHTSAIDRHEPFTCEGVQGLIERIAPEYLTLELISRNLADHHQKLTAQRTALHTFFAK